MRMIALMTVLILSGFAWAGPPCPDSKCGTQPPAIVVTIPQPMPGPRPVPTPPGVSVNVNTGRGPIVRVLAWFRPRGTGATVNVR